MLVNLDSLKSESVERLEDAGLFSGVADDDNEISQAAGDRSRALASMGEGRDILGIPWFEEMIEGSELGRMKRRRGGARSSDGKTVVEYEIAEFESGNGDDGTVATGKRKIGSLVDGDEMETSG